jgi:hypothetical protein
VSYPRRRRFSRAVVHRRCCCWRHYSAAPGCSATHHFRSAAGWRPCCCCCCSCSAPLFRCAPRRRFRCCAGRRRRCCGRLGGRKGRRTGRRPTGAFLGGPPLRRDESCWPCFGGTAASRIRKMKYSRTILNYKTKLITGFLHASYMHPLKDS